MYIVRRDVAKHTEVAKNKGFGFSLPDIILQELGHTSWLLNLSGPQVLENVCMTGI
jgi:hypothetical protein